MWVYIKPLAIAAMLMPVGWAAPVVLPFILLFARWDEEFYYDQRGHVLVRRGDLPSWASWFSTPDERLPGNPGEPGLLTALLWGGESLAAWVWLGVRNRGHGVAFKWAVKIPGPWPAEPGFFFVHDYADPPPRGSAPRVWWLRKPILGGRFHLKAGYRSYYVNNQWWGVPCLTITRP